jgi:hypothetical protein
MEAATSTALIHNPATGEVLDLTGAETVDLAAAMTGLADLRADLRTYEQAIEREILRRLDRDATWTLRVGEPTADRQFEITAPSPTAGTEGFDARTLQAELEQLIERGTITEQAAAGALARTLTVTVEVPFGHDLDALAKAAGGVEAIAGVPVRNAKASASLSAVKAGINKLRKVDGTGRALNRAGVRTDAPSRRPRVKSVWKDGRS